MNNQIIPFNFDDSLVRSALVDGQPWFVASDIAKILEYREAYVMTRMLDDDEKGPHIVRTLGGDQEMTIINQSGLYHAILKSRKPEARRFRKWVTGELLPELHRTGSYSLTNQGEKLRMEASKALNKSIDTGLKLVERIKREDNTEIRGMLHQYLQRTNDQLAIETPALAAFDNITSATAVLLDDFWEAVDHLEASGAAVSHLADTTRLAINLPHLADMAAANGVELPPLPALRRALRESQSPRFLNHVATSSVITGRTMKCWIFERQVAPE